jgi:hypothetical protein
MKLATAALAVGGVAYRPGIGAILRRPLQAPVGGAFSWTAPLRPGTVRTRRHEACGSIAPTVSPSSRAVWTIVHGREPGRPAIMLSTNAIAILRDRRRFGLV